VLLFTSMRTSSLKKQAETLLPTDWGNFKLLAYARRKDNPLPHLVLISEKFSLKNQPILVRIHSECMTGDVFHSRRCDCGEQLDIALQRANEEGGLVIYLRQEGRGIGLINKIKAYNLQDKGLNTAEANILLGFKDDARTYEDAITILKNLGIHNVHLLTNNPLKVKALEAGDITVHERIPILVDSKKENDFYLRTKRDLMGHLLL
jgi:GTP cyclohydrolase II